MSCCFIESQNRRISWVREDPQGSSPAPGHAQDTPKIPLLTKWTSRGQFDQGYKAVKKEVSWCHALHPWRRALRAGWGMCISHLPVPVSSLQTHSSSETFVRRAVQEPWSCLTQQLPVGCAGNSSMIASFPLAGLWGQQCLERQEPTETLGQQQQGAGGPGISFLLDMSVPGTSLPNIFTLRTVNWSVSVSITEKFLCPEDFLLPGLIPCLLGLRRTTAHVPADLFNLPGIHHFKASCLEYSLFCLL